MCVLYSSLFTDIINFKKIFSFRGNVFLLSIVHYSSNITIIHWFWGIHFLIFITLFWLLYLSAILVSVMFKQKSSKWKWFGYLFLFFYFCVLGTLIKSCKYQHSLTSVIIPYSVICTFEKAVKLQREKRHLYISLQNTENRWIHFPIQN